MWIEYMTFEPTPTSSAFREMQRWIYGNLEKREDMIKFEKHDIYYTLWYWTK